MIYDASLVVNSVDLSDHVASVTVTQNRADLDVTAMGATGVQRIAGLGDDSFDVDFWAGFAAPGGDAPLSGFVGGGGVSGVGRFWWGGVWSTTRTFRGSCILTAYTPIAEHRGTRTRS